MNENEQTSAPPAEVVAQCRAQLAEMRGHTGHRHVEHLVEIVDQFAAALQTLMQAPAKSDDDDDGDGNE